MSEITLQLTGMDKPPEAMASASIATAKPPGNTASATTATTKATTFASTKTTSATTDPVLSTISQAMAQIDELSPAQLQRVDTLANQIDLHDSAGIARYGASPQQRLTQFTGSTLDDAISQDTGEISSLFSNVRSNIQKLTDAKPLLTSKLSKRQQDEYAKISQALKQCENDLEGQKLDLTVSIKKLSRLHTQLVDSYKELLIYIEAGQRKLAETCEGELAELQRRADSTQDQADIFAYQKLADQCSNFSKRLFDFETTKTAYLQTAAQIQFAISTKQQLLIGIQSNIVHPIALCQQSIAIALTTKQYQQSLQAHSTELVRAISDLLES